VRCEELIGKEFGMFVERIWSWSGRLEDLAPNQLETFSAQLHELIEAQERAQKQLEAGPVVDIPPTESSTAG
jgi:hypothetical protein